MPFLYSTHPLPNQKRYTAQAVYRGLRTTIEVVESLAEKTGQDTAQIATLLQALGDYVVDNVMDGYRIEALYGRLGFQGSCGGSHEVANFRPDYDNLAVDVCLRLGPRAKRHARNVFRPEVVSHRGRVAPQVIRVTNMYNNRPNCYSPGKPMQVELSHRRGKFNPRDPEQGIFFKAADGTVARVDDYGYIRGKLCACMAPEGIEGPQQLIVARLIHGTLRSGIYEQPLAYVQPVEIPLVS